MSKIGDASETEALQYLTASRVDKKLHNQIYDLVDGCRIDLFEVVKTRIFIGRMIL